MNCEICKKIVLSLQCFNDCKELEHRWYISTNIVRVNVFNKHLGEHYDEQSLYLTCSMCLVNKHISSLDLEMQDVNHVSIFIDIDTHIPKIYSRNMSKDLI